MKFIKEFIRIMRADATPIITCNMGFKIPLAQLDRGSLDLLWNDLQDSRYSLDVDSKYTFDKLLVEIGMYTSLKLAREGIKAGAVSINDIKFTDPKLLIDKSLFLNPERESFFQRQIPYMFVRKGKRSYNIVRLL